MISIIIPNYNNRRYLGRCIGSVKRQTNRNWECIIIDDGSTDGSEEEIRNLIAGDSRFTFLCATKNKGLSSARNAGMITAKGEYLSFLDSDDWLPNDALDNLYGEAMVHPEVGRVIGRDMYRFEDGTVWGHSTEPAGLHTIDSQHLFSGPECDAGHSTGCLYIRKNMPSALFFPKVKLFEDMIFNMGLMFSGASTFVMNKYVYYYWRHDGTLLSKNLTEEDAQEERDALAALAERFNPPQALYDRCKLFLENAMEKRIQI